MAYLVLLVGEVEVVFYFFTDFGRLLGKVDTTGAAPWPPNKLQKITR